MENILIRKALKEDLKAILSLYAQSELDDGDVLTVDQAGKIYDKMMLYPDYNLYVAQMESRIVGTFALLIMDNLGHLGAVSGIIEDVAVDPEWQGQGVGTRMMKYAIEVCRDRGCYKAALSSNIKRKNAHRFYESLGFKHHGYSYLVDLDQ